GPRGDKRAGAWSGIMRLFARRGRRTAGVESLRHLSFLLAPVTAACLSACALGPDFKIPLAPEVPLTPKPVSAPGSAGGETQRFVHRLDIPGAWWRLFRSPELNRLIERALRDNYDLKSAQAALRVAHANADAQRGAFFPTIAANYNA